MSAIVVTSGQATLVAKEATETIPIVLCTGGDRPEVVEHGVTHFIVDNEEQSRAQGPSGA